MDPQFSHLVKIGNDKTLVAYSCNQKTPHFWEIWCVRSSLAFVSGFPSSHSELNRRASEQDSGAGRFFPGRTFLNCLRQSGDLSRAGRSREPWPEIFLANWVDHYGFTNHCGAFLLSNYPRLSLRRGILRRRAGESGHITWSGRRYCAHHRLQPNRGCKPDCRNAAIASAFPVLWPYKVTLALLALGIIMIINLRGLKESGTAMAIPVYLMALLYRRRRMGFQRIIIDVPYHLQR